MKCLVPEISWHNRDPVLSVDIQRSCDPALLRNDEITKYRIATGGTDGHVEIWFVKELPDGTVNVECVSDLKRHNRAVNVVRFSPDGKYLASGDDESALFIWKKSEREDDDEEHFENSDPSKDDQLNRDKWIVHKTLRGHLEDIQDLCWSRDSSCLVSGSVDNTAILWDVVKGQQIAMLNEHKGFVQGVAFDPRGQFVATLSTDRDLRIYNAAGSGRRCLHKISRVSLKVLPEKISSGFANSTSNSGKTSTPSVEEGNGQPSQTQQQQVKAVRLFHDDTLKTYSRRLDFSPDGEILFAPTGFLELNSSAINTFYAFSRINLAQPAVVYPLGPKTSALAIRCCPVLFQLRKLDPTPALKRDDEGMKEEEREEEEVTTAPSSLFALPYRMVFAVITQDSLVLYDTQSALPFTKIANIHYTRLSDLSWSSDGRLLMIASTDGYCSFVTFRPGELGEVYTPPAKAMGEGKSNPPSSCVSPASKASDGDKSPVPKVVVTSPESSTSVVGAKDGNDEEAKPTKADVDDVEPMDVGGDGSSSLAKSGEKSVEEPKTEKQKTPFVIHARSSKHGGRRIEIITHPRDGGDEAAKKCRPFNGDNPSTADDQDLQQKSKDDVNVATTCDSWSTTKRTPDKKRSSPAPPDDRDSAKRQILNESGGGDEGDKMDDSVSNVSASTLDPSTKDVETPSSSASTSQSAKKKRVPFQTLSSPKTYKKKPATS